ncbi:hypothetical protein NLO98_17855 [Pseudomonas syringae]|nr:hypothetical protein [Pseudomonas syringae]
MSLKENAQVREASIGADVPLDMEARPILMRWDIKAHAHPTVYVDVPMIAIGSFPLMCYLYGAFVHQNENTKHLFTDTALFGMALVFFLWVTIARQKTFYSYRISEEGGEVDHWLYFPKCAGWIFKGIAVFVLGHRAGHNLNHANDDFCFGRRRRYYHPGCVEVAGLGE